ncbi:MAG: hypothetical protein A3E26_02965 [Chlamydiae bacterium RIFCSPHIGHO2_12_FULL_49_32]|nr:MAG: hypothetical protein A3E26_02965 [Chlamydiae bacterium RIFCSPHIGHO2_12_FULL_49_32]
MSFRRLWAVFLRYFYYATKGDQLSDLFYWPAIDIFIWGITSLWIQHQDSHLPGVALVILTALIFWQIVWRATYEISVNILREFWDRNLLNFFATPLKPAEWMGGVMLLSLCKIVVSFLFGAFIVFFLYSLNIFNMGFVFLPYLGSLALSGWFLGFLSGGIVIYFGQRVQMLAWVVAYLFSPFSAIFYPVSALPGWGQAIAKALPMSYIFEGLREVLYQHTLGGRNLATSYLLNLLYLVLSMSFFVLMLEKSRKKGLGRLE